MELLRYDKPVGTVFDLLGQKEDDMTYALGFVVSRSPKFAEAVVAELGDALDNGDDGVVRLQTSDADGRTDVEIETDQLHVVFEAKRGPTLPTLAQLRRYVPRVRRAGRTLQRLVAVTNAPEDFARASLPGDVDGVEVRHLRWRDVRRLAREARRRETNANKRLLEEFGRYLTEMVGMEVIRSNMVYVLSIGAGGAFGLDFRKVATEQRAYFDPVSRYRGGRPNYIAFRYDARLRSIHFVESVEMFTNPRSVFPEADDVEVEPHYVFRLGPPIVPPHEVKYGPKISRAMRVYCMIDTLLTCSTITEALEESKRRSGEGGR